jgi:erythronate-4-phosphate dehydrogenase
VVVLNASRGEVIETAALVRTLVNRRDLKVVLDVWENEPDINAELLRLVSLASPHIAGYSIEAKTNATRQLKQGFCEFFNLAPIGLTERAFTDQQEFKLTLDAVSESDYFCSGLLTQVLDLQQISRKFKKVSSNQTLSAADIFDAMRNSLRNRHEFSNFCIGANRLTSQQKQLLNMLDIKSDHAESTSGVP